MLLLGSLVRTLAALDRYQKAAILGCTPGVFVRVRFCWWWDLMAISGMVLKGVRGIVPAIAFSIHLLCDEWFEHITPQLAVAKNKLPKKNRFPLKFRKNVPENIQKLWSPLILFEQRLLDLAQHQLPLSFTKLLVLRWQPPNASGEGDSGTPPWKLLWSATSTGNQLRMLSPVVLMYLKADQKNAGSWRV